MFAGGFQLSNSVAKPGEASAPSSTVVVAGSYVLGAGQSLSFHNQNGLIVRPTSESPFSVVVAGQLTVDLDLLSGRRASVIGFDPAPFNPVSISIETTGVLDIRWPAGLAVGIDASITVPKIANHGFINVQANFDASGIIRSGNSELAGLAVVNTGTIQATSTAASGVGVSLLGSGSVDNSGTIDVRGAADSYGVRIYGAGGLINSGTIRAHSTSPTGAGVAVSFDAILGDRPFLNSGTLEGEYALLGSIRSVGFGTATIQNTGRMIGAVGLGDGNQVLANSGVIQGAVDLGAGADTYSGATGSTSGMVSGGDGADVLEGGAGFDNFQGNTGTDTESGGAGDDWVVGGKDSDRLSGDSGADLVYGNLGNDTCDGGEGNDIVRGGQQDDVLSGGAGDDFLAGDRDNDTITGGAGADIFSTHGAAGLDRVTDFSLTQGDRVQLDPGTQYTVAQVGLDTVISMTGGGQMILVGVSMGSLTGAWISVG